MVSIWVKYQDYKILRDNFQKWSQVQGDGYVNKNCILFSNETVERVRNSYRVRWMFAFVTSDLSDM